MRPALRQYPALKEFSKKFLNILCKENLAYWDPEQNKHRKKYN